ncbi:hypothetical protein ZWY2020_007233 [Hordeum vulgare]|nr:hypothetical protein ZWY2020_007233 [Hordeum vulgare]
MDMLHQFHVRLEEESRLRQEAQDNALLQQEQAMKMQQTLIQQQEFMAKQQAALQETFAWFSNNMQCSTLPDLPPVPPLPTSSLLPICDGNWDEKIPGRVLYEILIQAGHVVDLYIPCDKETGRPKGFAFAEYETEAIAQYAVRLFSGLVRLNGKTLKFASIA